MKKELNELVAGDLVAYRPALSSRTRIATVKRTTQTQIIMMKNLLQ